MIYHIEIRECIDGGFTAYHLEYDTYGDGNTPTEALIDLAEVLRDLEEIANGSADF